MLEMMLKRDRLFADVEYEEYYDNIDDSSTKDEKIVIFCCLIVLITLGISVNCYALLKAIKVSCNSFTIERIISVIYQLQHIIINII